MAPAAAAVPVAISVAGEARSCVLRFGNAVACDSPRVRGNRQATIAMYRTKRTSYTVTKK